MGEPDLSPEIDNLPIPDLSKSFVGTNPKVPVAILTKRFDVVAWKAVFCRVVS
jgi:hypothetical protein